MAQARRKLLVSATFALALPLAGCFSSSSSGPTDASGDGAFVEDTTLDMGNDAAEETGVVAADAPGDSPSARDGTGADEGSLDAGADADATLDAPADAPSEAQGPSVYVDPVNGVDTNPGTQALPFKTLYQATRARSAADAGTGTVYLADGTYDSATQTSFWGTFTNPTFVRGSAPGNVILSGSYASEVLYFAAGGGIANVTFRNTTTSFQVQHGTFTASGLGFDGLPGFNAEGASFLNDTVATVDTMTIANMSSMGGQDIGAIFYADQNASLTWDATGTAITSPTSSPGQALFARSGARMAITGLTLTNYPGFAAVLYDQAQLSLTSSTITGTAPAQGICSAAGCRASIWLGGSQTGVPTGALTLVGTTISGSPGSAVGYSTTNNTGAVQLSMTNSHLDNNALAGLWIGGATNAALSMNVTATGTTFDGNAMAGIRCEPRATIAVSGGSMSTNGAGAAALAQTPGGLLMLDGASASSLTMRNVTLAGNTGNFVTMAGSAATVVDLGTTASPGGLTFTGVVASALDLTAPVTANAVGDTWMPSVQGADTSGHITAATTITGPASGLNVTVPSGASVVMK